MEVFLDLIWRKLRITTPDYPEYVDHSYKRVGLMLFERMVWVLKNKNQKDLDTVRFVADQLLYKGFALIDWISYRTENESQNEYVKRILNVLRKYI